MQKRTKRVCQDCGKLFYAKSSDKYYCDECAKKRRTESVIRIRTCQDCGKEFKGGPRAKRCTECAHIAKNESHKKYKSEGAKRPLGSIDKCNVCGKEYIVVSARQRYCSYDCQKGAVLQWQRERKSIYNKESGYTTIKIEKRKENKKVCPYCLTEFHGDTSSSYCSDYCRSENIKLLQCEADLKRGYKRNLKKYEDKRENYRVVKKENGG